MMNLKNISKKIIICFMCISLCFSSVQVSVYASGAAALGALDQFLQGIVLEKVWDTGVDAVNSVKGRVENWLSTHKSYYNQRHGGGGHTDTERERKYYDNNSSINQVIDSYNTTNQQFVDNSTSNQYSYTTYDDSVSSIDSRTYSLVKDTYNIETNTYNTLIYNPVTNNYTTVNNISYNNQYDTYYITNNEYNYYVTNNYTYVSYYIINNTTNEESYYEIYYEMPDGRDSYYLEKEDIWGEYFVYDVANYELVAEDDGTTLALYHLDGNLKDSSYWTNADASGGGGIYYDSKFGSGYYISSATSFYYPSSFDVNNFTLEFVINITINNQYISEFKPLFSLNGQYYKISDGFASGTYYMVFQCNNGSFTAYVNGDKKNVISTVRNYGGATYIPIMFAFDSSAIKFNQTRLTYCTDTINNTYSAVYVSYILDEVRLSNCTLYSADSISVPSQPFDTNMVLAVPENPTESMIAIRANYEIADCRIGGVRPTYPSLGDVYIYLEDDVVKDIQQYEGDAWYSVSGAIYTNGSWSDLSGYSMAALTFEEEEDSGSSGSDTDSNDGSVSDNTVSGNGSDGSGITDLIDGIGKILDTILSLIGKVMGLVGDFGQAVLDLFSGFTTFTDGFSSFLADTFTFIPEEALNLITLGIGLMVLLAFIKFLRG